MSPLTYPEELEQWWLRESVRVLKQPDPIKCLDQLLPEVQRLSDLFTVERAPGFGGYAEQPLAQLAYGVYFFPQSFARTLRVLQEVWPQGPALWPPDRPGRLLDLGAGLGAATLAAAAQVGAEHEIAITALDQSASGLGLLQRLFEEGRSLWPHAKLQILPGDLQSIPAGSWDLIVCSFALNESFPDDNDGPIRSWIKEALGHLTPSGALLLLEPATQTAATRMERLRDGLAQEGAAQILGPCPHHEACPLLQNGHAWCHEVRHWEAPAAMGYLNRKLHRSIDVLKFSFLALRPGKSPAGIGGPDFTRLIAPMCEIKGKLVTSGCAADGKAYTYELLTRRLHRADKKRLLAIERGDLVRWQGLTPLGNAAFRAEQAERARP